VSLKIANTLYDIFIQELRARESTREDFCAQYELGLAEIPVYVAARARSDARARYTRTPDHLGGIVATYDPQGAMRVNQAIADLENRLVRMSPLERIDWFNEESACPLLEQSRVAET